MRLKARAVFTVLLAFLVAVPVVAATVAQFPDVPPDHPDFEVIDWTREQELFKGYPNGLFQPERQLSETEFDNVLERLFDRYDAWTRAETATFLYYGDRALKGHITAPAPSVDRSKPGEDIDYSVDVWINRIGSLIVEVTVHNYDPTWNYDLSFHFGQPGYRHPLTGVWTQSNAEYPGALTGHGMDTILSYPLYPSENRPGEFHHYIKRTPEMCGWYVVVNYLNPGTGTGFTDVGHYNHRVVPCPEQTPTTTTTTTIPPTPTTTTTWPVVIEPTTIPTTTQPPTTTTTTTAPVSPPTTHFDDTILKGEDKTTLEQFWRNWRVVIALAWAVNAEWEIVGKPWTQIDEVEWSQTGLMNIAKAKFWSDELFEMAEGWLDTTEDNIALYGRTDYLSVAESKWSQAYISSRDLAAQADVFLDLVPSDVKLPQAPNPPWWPSS